MKSTLFTLTLICTYTIATHKEMETGEHYRERMLKAERKRQKQYQEQLIQRRTNASLNQTYRSIWDVIHTLDTIRPTHQNVLYKEGWDDVMYLLKRGVNKLEL